jgi:beta-lactamase regulating signal transducer with metallopeptidase domain
MNGIEALSSLPLMRPVAWALTHFLWQGALVGVFLAAALVLLDGKSASLRYVVSVGALAVLLVLPVATTFWLARAWEKALAPVERPLSGAASPDDRPASASVEPDLEPPCPEALLWFLAFWTSGVAVLSLYNAGGWIQVRRLRRQRIRPVPESWEKIVDGLRRRLGIARAVRILETSALAVPAVIGCLRPVILVPASALTGLTPRQLEAILAHELAHVRRHDYAVNLFQTVVETLLFYHPVVWWVSRVIRREREHCCDDLAVALCGDRIIYARALAELEGLRATPPRFVMASANGPLLLRVRRIAGLPSQPSHSWLAGALALSLVPVGAALHISNAAGPRLLPHIRETLNDFLDKFGGLPREERQQFADDGVTAELIREWKHAGYPHKPVRDRDDLRWVAYDFKELRHHGVTTDDFWAMFNRGYEDPHLLKAQGITLESIQNFANLGYDGLTRKQLVRFWNLGIDAKLIHELATLGYKNVPPEDLIALRENHVDAAFIQEARTQEGRSLSMKELVKLKQEARLQKTLREELWMGGG